MAAFVRGVPPEHLQGVVRGVRHVVMPLCGLRPRGIHVLLLLLPHRVGDALHARLPRVRGRLTRVDIRLEPEREIATSVIGGGFCAGYL